MLSSIVADDVDEVERIRMANAITNIHAVLPALPASYRPAPSTSTSSRNTFQVSYCATSALTPKQTLKLFEIFESNMKVHYEETWGWNKNERFKEIFDPASRFIIVSSSATMDGENDAPPSVKDVDPATIAGYCTYRFCWDDDDEPEHPVMYVYELQVHSAHRGLGIGRRLTETTVQIGQALRMWKVMLTCFKRNEQALRFYLQSGFSIDANSPSAFGNNDEDYEILSHA